MAKIKKPGENNSLCEQGEQDERHLQTQVSPLDGKVKQYYGMKVSTILNAADKLTADLDYLCSLVEKPDAEFPLSSAIVYSHAVVALSAQLDFILEDLAEKELSDDEEYVKISKDDIVALNTYTEASEDALALLEKTCGICLQNN